MAMRANPIHDEAGRRVEPLLDGHPTPHIVGKCDRLSDSAAKVILTCKTAPSIIRPVKEFSLVNIYVLGIMHEILHSILPSAVYLCGSGLHRIGCLGAAVYYGMDPEYLVSYLVCGIFALVAAWILYKSRNNYLDIGTEWIEHNGLKYWKIRKPTSFGSPMAVKAGWTKGISFSRCIPPVMNTM